MGYATGGGMMFSKSSQSAHAALVVLLLSCATLLSSTLPADAAGEVAGPVTGLPVPRYVSLKNDRVNLREGPSKEHRTTWVFQRSGLPVEITGEFETWRRIRDAEGAEGWVLHSLLSGRRTALVMPWSKKPADVIALHERADDNAQVVARLTPNVLASVKSCAGSWCRVSVSDHDGFIRQDRLWGVYPNERMD
ncbi:MAG: SH3 domain-containing protein [Bosea sp. (in: a-proteobacteria)]